MQWHPQAYVLIAGTVDGEVYMWKIPDGECKIIQGHGKRAETSCLMPDGNLINLKFIFNLDDLTCFINTLFLQENDS